MFSGNIFLYGVLTFSLFEICYHNHHKRSPLKHCEFSLGVCHDQPALQTSQHRNCTRSAGSYGSWLCFPECLYAFVFCGCYEPGDWTDSSHHIFHMHILLEQICLVCGRRRPTTSRPIFIWRARRGSLISRACNQVLENLESPSKFHWHWRASPSILLQPLLNNVWWASMTQPGITMRRHQTTQNLP